MTTELKEVVTFTNRLKAEDLVWKPMYPNNMSCNGETGMYSIVSFINTDGTISNCRKYTILFQHPEIEPGAGLVDNEYVDKYILFEKSYPVVHGGAYYEGPYESEPPDLWRCKGRTFSSTDMNDYGRFVYAYDKLEHAMMRAETQYKAIFGYALSHLLGDEEND